MIARNEFLFISKAELRGYRSHSFVTTILLYLMSPPIRSLSIYTCQCLYPNSEEHNPLRLWERECGWDWPFSLYWASDSGWYLLILLKHWLLNADSWIGLFFPHFQYLFLVGFISTTSIYLYHLKFKRIQSPH